MELTIIAVDDQEFNLLVLDEMCKEIGFEIKTFMEPEKVLEYLADHEVDIMISDYMMPNINGIELIAQSKRLQPDLISVMVTAVSDDRSLKVKALEVGATDFLTKPIDIAELQAKIKNLSQLKQSQNILKNFNQTLQQQVALATQTLVEREHETLKTLSRTAEYRDPETGSHIARVAHYSKMLARLSGLSEEEQNIVFYASPLHDIGKVGISDAILLKPGKLTDEEFETMKQHAMIGYEILRESKYDYLQAGAIIAKTHHEKYDGSGYPLGLRRDEIHLYGRITALADVFDALTSIRPYKKAWSFEEGMEHLEKNSGSHFDPALVKMFLAHQEEVREIYEKFSEEEN